MTSDSGIQGPLAVTSISPGKGKLYGYEVPSLAPGKYDIKVNQTIAAQNESTAPLQTVQQVEVKAVSPYALPPALIHSFYPPRLRAVSAETLPHILLKGSLPWERTIQNAQQRPEGAAPWPWLALMVFAEDELSIPAELMNSDVKPSATLAVGLPIKAVNAMGNKVLLRQSFPPVPKATDVSGDSDYASFIFVKANILKDYFSPQDGSPRNGLDLKRYLFLGHVTDTGLIDETGFSTVKISTLIGHRARPYMDHTRRMTVHAHLVSLEHVRAVLDCGKITAEGSKDGLLAPLVSLFSWTYSWEPRTASGTELFESLGQQVHPLAVRLPELLPGVQTTPSEEWMRNRLENGYTIVRHRDIAGEASMAIFRGPLMPRPRPSQGSDVARKRLPQIKPSMHGTDMQIIDLQTKMLDVSYSVAWDLGRSLAGRDVKFSNAVATLRRELTLHAMLKARAADKPSMIQDGEDLLDSVLNKLDKLFEGSLDEKLKGMPEKGRLRWQQPRDEALAPANPSVIMTQAKLRRHLKKETREWVATMVDALVRGRGTNLGQSDCEVSALGAVIGWVLENLLSMRLIPALYFFPDPSVIKAESIGVFHVDDIWMDAFVDGALSVSNTVGGGDDPVRTEIRVAINKYILDVDRVDPSRAKIVATGFVIKSALIESFPDLEIKAKSKNASIPDPFVLRQATHGDLSVCLFTRTNGQRMREFDANLKLPPHQNRFAVQGISQDTLSFSVQLQPFLDASASPQPPEGDTSAVVTWNRSTAAGALWSWSTGMLAPHVVADLVNEWGAKKLGKAFKKLEQDSSSVYVAVQLAERNHKLVVPFEVTDDHQRQLFSHYRDGDEDDMGDDAGGIGRDPATVHDPRAIPALTPAPGADPSQPTAKSWFTKRVFSLLYPGKSIPARSKPATQLVFAIKPVPVPATPGSKKIRVASLEFIIPLGDASGDLLDHQAPLPRIKALNPAWPWIAAIFTRNNDTELVVQLEPRVGGAESVSAGTGRLQLSARADASFVLTGATVNGVVGSNVVIRTKEVYQEAGQSTTHTIRDSWIVVKEE